MLRIAGFLWKTLARLARVVGVVICWVCELVIYGDRASKYASDYFCK